MAKIDLMGLPKKTLVDLLKTYSKNSMTVDGLWFVNVEEKFGLDTAIEIDTMVWERYGATEARRIKKALHITDGGIPALAKALNFQIWVPGMEYEFPEVTDKSLVFNVTDCTVQRARIRNNRPEFKCKSVGEALFAPFAKTIDPGLEMECLMCPPDEHPEDVWCSWKFSLKEEPTAEINGDAKIDYFDLSEGTLIELIKMYSKNVITIDGLWFINIEERFDLDTAIDIDIKVWERYGVTEARRLKRVLNIGEGGGIPALVKALNFQIWVPGMDYEFPEVTEKSVVFNVTDCTPQKARIRDKRGEFPCKPVGVALFKKFAETIDPRLNMKCLVCPPDSHPENVWCSWEFRLEEHI